MKLKATQLTMLKQLVFQIGSVALLASLGGCGIATATAPQSTLSAIDPEAYRLKQSIPNSTFESIESDENPFPIKLVFGPFFGTGPQLPSLQIQDPLAGAPNGTYHYDIQSGSEVEVHFKVFGKDYPEYLKGLEVKNEDLLYDSTTDTFFRRVSQDV